MIALFLFAHFLLISSFTHLLFYDLKMNFMRGAILKEVIGGDPCTRR